MSSHLSNSFQQKLVALSPLIRIYVVNALHQLQFDSSIVVETTLGFGFRNPWKNIKFEVEMGN